MLIVILNASFPCRGPFSQRIAGHFDKADLMQLLRQGFFKMSMLNVKRMFLITKLCMQQPSLTLTLSLTLSSREQTSFSPNIFHFQRLWSVSLHGIWGCFPNPLYSVSFSLESLTWYFPIVHILMRLLKFLLQLIYIVQGIYTFPFLHISIT